MIVATAGHVDHGKTSLIKQLTGVDTDTLKEEKQRGLSINLGYAYLANDNKSIGFIDVPGHRRFINTMISGVSSINLALVAVAANEGLKPQTIEHLEILRLLDIKRYLIVLTHIDKTDTTQRKLVAKQVQKAIGLGTPVFEVDNMKGTGIDRLRDYLLTVAEEYSSNSKNGYFRLSIDRTFLLKGVGLTVTGTVMSGRVSEGENLVLLPHKKNVRVREIYSQNEKSRKSQIGERCALQISGIEKKDISRGDWLHGRFDILNSNRINVRLEISSYLNFTVKHLCPVKLYIGAKLISAKLYLLARKTDGFSLAAGSRVYAQIIIEGEVSCCKGDKFVLRDDSELVTLGGGSVLEPWAEYDPVFAENKRRYLEALELPTPLQTLTRLAIEGKCLVNLTHFELLQNLNKNDLETILKDEKLKKKIRLFSDANHTYLVSRENWDQCRHNIINCIKDYHRSHPDLPGADMDRLLVDLNKVPDKVLVTTIVNELKDEKVLIQTNGYIGIPGFVPILLETESAAWQIVEQAMRAYHQQIPTFSNIQDDLSLEKMAVDLVLKKALKEGRVYKLGGNRVVLPDLLVQFADKIKQLVARKPRFLVSEVKSVLGLGRNSCIDLMEYFDQIGFTRRIGSERVINDSEVINRYRKIK